LTRRGKGSKIATKEKQEEEERKKIRHKFSGDNI